MTKQEHLNIFITNIETLMSEENLSKAELAEKISVNISEIEDLYSGGDFEKFHILIMAADNFNVAIDWLVGLDKEKFTAEIKNFLKTTSGINDLYSEVEFKKFQTIIKIADYFYVSVDWIICLTDERKLFVASDVPQHVRIENPIYYKNSVKYVKHFNKDYEKELSAMESDLEYCKNNNFDSIYIVRIEKEIENLKCNNS